MYGWSASCTNFEDYKFQKKKKNIDRVRESHGEIKIHWLCVKKKKFNLQKDYLKKRAN